eukprot:PhM_4_TR11950/c0_g1_i1/m.87325/K06185/ABCF2; ATP-binding cassette, subfamily F, member 2
MGKKDKDKKRSEARARQEAEEAAAAAAANKAPSASGATVSFQSTRCPAGVSDISVENVDINYHGKDILSGATLQLYAGHRYGMLGVNGCGKTTLMNVLGCGEIPFPPKVDWYHVTHEVDADDRTPVEIVVSADREKQLLEAELEELLTCDGEIVAHRMDEIYARLDELEADTAEARAGRILFGLGFTAEMQDRPSKSFSGGWRMRIALAQALFLNPTLLLLDEPTNHLDIEAVVWLEQYLQKFKKILLMVSHSQDFMNTVCTKIINMNRGKLVYYDGNYDQYVITRAEKESHQMKRFAWQQSQIKSMKEYIARFGHGSKKLARQAQSKEKTLTKMERGGLEEKVHKDRNVTFEFPSSGYLPPPVVQFNEVAFAYAGREQLFGGLDFGLDLDSRVCLCGPNGAGKTTLTKLIIGELEPTNGIVVRKAHLIIARYHQHSVDLLNMEMSPLEWMRSEYPEILTPEPLRSVLGRMGVSGPLQTQPIGTLSDGQMSRVVFAWMAMKRPHMLILDEPTNHLDIESIDALGEAINAFEGAVIVVSHDLRLIAQIADEIWVAENGAVTKFPGDIADYKEYVEKTIERLGREFEKKKGYKK